MRDCPDCAGTWADHAAQCPIASAITQQCDDDGAFFRKYPHAGIRQRKPNIWELMQILVVGGCQIPEPPDTRHWHAGGHVVVVQVAPGVRARIFDHAVLVLNPDRPVDRMETPVPAPSRT